MTPSCEIRYRKLQSLLAEHRKAVSNKRTNLTALDKLLSAFLDDIERYGPDVLPQSASYLFRNADVDNSVYNHSFENMNGIVLVTKGVIVDGIDQAVQGTFGVFSYEMAIQRVFEELSVKDQELKIHRIRFATIRFGSDFWEVALHGLYRFVTPKWSKYNEEMQEFLFSCFASNFQAVMKQWMKTNFTASYVDSCIKLLESMNNYALLWLEGVQSGLAPFLSSQLSTNNIPIY